MARTPRFGPYVFAAAIVLLAAFGSGIATPTASLGRDSAVGPAATALSASLLAYASVTSAYGEYAPFQIPVVLSFEPNVTGGVPPYSAAWNFGDGSPVDASWGPSHRFAVSGLFLATLVVTDAQGSTATGTVAFETFDPTIAAVNPMASPALTTTYQSVLFQPPQWSGLVLGYNWTFGDGGSSTVAQPSHEFAVPGDYPVVLWEEVWVTTSTGSSSLWNVSFVTTVLSLGSAVPDFASAAATFEGFAGSCTYPPRFTDTFVPNALGPAVSYHLDFGDGSSIAGSVGDVAWRGTNHEFQSYGPITARLTVTTSDGQLLTATLMDVGPPNYGAGAPGCYPPFPPFGFFGAADPGAVAVAVAVYLGTALVATVVVPLIARARQPPRPDVTLGRR